jgi:predicted nucleic acid-binding protein
LTLLDTNVISELAKPRPNANVIAWRRDLDRVIVSAVTIEEVAFGLTLRPSSRIDRWLDQLLAVGQVLDVTVPIARHAGVLRGQLAARGKVRGQADMLIAATATIHGLTLATRNVRDFDGCGITVVNPFA